MERSQLVQTACESGAAQVWVTATGDLPGSVRAGWDAHAGLARCRAEARRFDIGAAAYGAPARDGYTILAAIPLKTATFLDVGCGYGQWSRLLEVGRAPLPQWRYTGTEIIPQQVEVCRGFNPRVRFEVADTRDLPFDDHCYDVVFSSGVLPWVHDWRAILRQCARVSGGYVVLLRTAVIKYGPSRICRAQVSWEGKTEVHHMWALRRDELHEAIAEAGLHLAALDYSDNAHPVEGLGERLFWLNYLLTTSASTRLGRRRTPSLLAAS